MSENAAVVVFDVNETLSDMAPFAHRFADVGAPEHLAKLWFATLLRDGFALAAAGASERFAVIGRSVLRGLLSGVELDRGLDEAVDHVLDGFGALDVHPDVVEGVRALRAQGRRLVTLTNGATSVADRLLTTAGIRDEFEALLSVEEAGLWKPAEDAYLYAAQECGVRGEELVLVPVHPWDIDGARRAGLQAAWLDRSGMPYPEYFLRAHYTASSLPDLARRLASRS